MDRPVAETNVLNPSTHLATEGDIVAASGVAPLGLDETMPEKGLWFLENGNGQLATDLVGGERLLLGTYTHYEAESIKAYFYWSKGYSPAFLSLDEIRSRGASNGWQTVSGALCGCILVCDDKCREVTRIYVR